MKKQTKIPANKTGDAKQKRIVLVGTYKGSQLEDWPGWYCWPLGKDELSRAETQRGREEVPHAKSAKFAKGNSDLSEAPLTLRQSKNVPSVSEAPETSEFGSLASVTELWLYKGTQNERRFKAEFIGVKTRDELVRDYGYPATGKPHGDRYALSKTEKLYRHMNRRK